MSIAIKDIPEETWNKLREEYQDELATMSSIEEDELNCMIVNSKNNNEKFDEYYFIHENYMLTMQALEYLYNFETTGWDYNLRCITFTRTVERGETHEVILEDHRDDDSIHNWLIFSSLKDSITNWEGQKEDAQYPLQLDEYTRFAKLIECLEKLYPLEKSEPPIMSKTK